MKALIIGKGHKAFHGWMKVLWTNTEPEEIYGDWIYEPMEHTWYCGDKGYPAEICVIQEIV